MQSADTDFVEYYTHGRAEHQLIGVGIRWYMNRSEVLRLRRLIWQTAAPCYFSLLVTTAGQKNDWRRIQLPPDVIPLNREFFSVQVDGLSSHSGTAVDDDRTLSFLKVDLGSERMSILQSRPHVRWMTVRSRRTANTWRFCRPSWASPLCLLFLIAARSRRSGFWFWISSLLLVARQGRRG
jgi:hypothetical protein